MKVYVVVLGTEIRGDKLADILKIISMDEKWKALKQIDPKLTCIGIKDFLATLHKLVKRGGQTTVERHFHLCGGLRRLRALLTIDNFTKELAIKEIDKLLTNDYKNDRSYNYDKDVRKAIDDNKEHFTYFVGYKVFFEEGRSLRVPDYVKNMTIETLPEDWKAEAMRGLKKLESKGLDISSLEIYKREYLV